MSAYLRRSGAALACALAVACAWPGNVAAQAPPVQTTEAAQTDLHVFDQVWHTVKDRFYDPRLHGVDWDAVRARYLPAAARAGTAAERAGVINAMLAELHASHTGLYTPDQPEYYQLAAVFAGTLRRQGLRKFFPDGKITYPGIGLFTEADARGRIFATGVIDGAPAAQAGLLTGDEILSADGAPFRPVESFRGKVGQQVVLELRRQPDASPMRMAVIPQSLEPNEMFLHAIEASARVIAGADGTRIAYVRIWNYASDFYQAAFEKLLVTQFKDADALIWDLRGGWGGAQPEYLAAFDPHEPTVLLTDRRGEIRVDHAVWRKPVAMLINGGTRSGKEILAYGFKRYHAGELIGTRTEGAVLAATAFLMDDGSLLLLPVEDVHVDGIRLEGVGVAPTIEVPFDLPYAAGRDPQRDRAVAVLSAEVQR